MIISDKTKVGYKMYSISLKDKRRSKSTSHGKNRENTFVWSFYFIDQFKELHK